MSKQAYLDTEIVHTYSSRDHWGEDPDTYPDPGLQQA